MSFFSSKNVDEYRYRIQDDLEQAMPSVDPWTEWKRKMGGGTLLVLAGGGLVVVAETCIEDQTLERVFDVLGGVMALLGILLILSALSVLCRKTEENSYEIKSSARPGSGVLSRSNSTANLGHDPELLEEGGILVGGDSDEEPSSPLSVSG